MMKTDCANSHRRKVVLVDYDEDLFSPPDWMGEELAKIGANWHVGQHREKEAVLHVTHDADVVMVQSVRPLLTGDVIRQMERCRCIARLGIGYDSVDVGASTSEGILVCNVPTYCIDDVAEHALALMFDAVRHVARQDRWIRAGRWDRSAARPARRISGSTLGLVAFGRIARAVAGRAKGFGVNVIAFDPYVDVESMSQCGAEKVGLEELLRRSDFISVHAPLTDSTRHLLSWREFEMVKPGAVLVNTSRGPVVDNAALADALSSGRLWGAGLDVMEQEPLPADSPLRALENVTFTPHVGASSEESTTDLYRTAYEIARDVLGGHWPGSAVNPEVRPRSPLSRDTQSLS